jgi:hypothetical protein
MSKTKATPVHLTTILEFILFLFYLVYDSWMYIRLQELQWYHSCITILFNLSL